MPSSASVVGEQFASGEDAIFGKDGCPHTRIGLQATGEAHQVTEAVQADMRGQRTSAQQAVELHAWRANAERPNQVWKSCTPSRAPSPGNNVPGSSTAPK